MKITAANDYGMGKYIQSQQNPVKWMVQGRVSAKRVKNILEIGCPKNE